MDKTKKTILTIVMGIAVAFMAVVFAVTHWFIGKGREMVEEAKNEETTTEAVAVTTEEIAVENDVINVDFVGTGAVVAVRNDNNGTDAVENENTADENAVEITTNNTTVMTTANTTVETPKTTEAPVTTAPKTTEAPATTNAPVVQACQHDWKTVVDKEAYDEPVYEEKDIYGYASMWRDGTIDNPKMETGDRITWCYQHCVSCHEAAGTVCPDPDPRGYCAIYDNWSYVTVVGTETVQTGTKHYDAVTHQECTRCGATR